MSKTRSIRDMIGKKKERIIKTNAEFIDINKPLMKALFGISVWGKEAYEEDVMELIIGDYDDSIGEGKRLFQAIYEEGKAKFGKNLRTKSGRIVDPEGRIYLIPKV